jgi:hypothetical protein
VNAFTESVVEQAALAWLEGAGWQVRNGAELAPDEATAVRESHTLASPRDTLLPRLISGELRVGGATTGKYRSLDAA